MFEPKATNDFGKRCLLARRLVERGVRFIQLYSGGAHNDDNWDAHGDLEKNHNLHARETDQPIAALLKDLKQRGLLDSTLGRLGRRVRSPADRRVCRGTGRDHNAYDSPCGWPAAVSREVRALERPTNSEPPPSSDPCT